MRVVLRLAMKIEKQDQMSLNSIHRAFTRRLSSRLIAHVLDFMNRGQKKSDEHSQVGVFAMNHD